MGIILIETEDEIQPCDVDLIEKNAQKVLGKEYRKTIWYYNAEDEDQIVRLAEKLIANIED
jgi:hypothetical protein